MKQAFVEGAIFGQHRVSLLKLIKSSRISEDIPIHNRDEGLQLGVCQTCNQLVESLKALIGVQAAQEFAEGFWIEFRFRKIDLRTGGVDLAVGGGVFYALIDSAAKHSERARLSREAQKHKDGNF
ncbi:MAG: hypothetical protein A2070_01970 [Bdellovibrionales bacterium GWC1_52_8]|nr:MAG: hypothetical protein A2Z97_11045 [Bdellovibrionales bacterium GWB1_52_6]OFZ39550.1 MAG: hypothetical protein A2070_01970 [Bdellovibrionales bacterium GWC1_52_8]